MQLKDIVAEFGAFKKKVDALQKALHEIERLERERGPNLHRLRRQPSKLKPLIANLAEATRHHEVLSGWLSRYPAQLEAAEKELQQQLGPALESELQRIGLSLRGHYPKLKAGLFTIEVDFENLSATLWYGPEQEQLAGCRPEAREIARRLQEARDRLGSGLGTEEFLQRLYSVYTREVGPNQQPVPINQVLPAVAFAIQSSKFRNDPRSEHYRTYGRADFSYDLFRCRTARLQLITATRSYTRNRADFLWVPTDEHGDGTTFSHLKFEEKPNEQPQSYARPSDH